MEGQGSFGSWKEDRGAGKPGRGAEAVWVRSLGKKLEEDAVCSAHLLPAGLGLTPGHSLALVSPGSLVTWSTLAGNPALWGGQALLGEEISEEQGILLDLDILAPGWRFLHLRKRLTFHQKFLVKFTI